MEEENVIQNKHIQDANILIDKIQTYCSLNPIENNLFLFWDKMELFINNLVNLLLPFFPTEHRIGNIDLFKSLNPLCIRGNFSCDKTVLVIRKGFYSYITHILQEYILLNKMLTIRSYVDMFNRTFIHHNNFHISKLRYKDEFNILTTKLKENHTQEIKNGMRQRMGVIKKTTTTLDKNHNNFMENFETEWKRLTSPINISILDEEVETALSRMILHNGHMITTENISIETIKQIIDKFDKIIIVLKRIIFLREVDSFCKEQSIPEDVRRGRILPTDNQQDKIDITNDHSKFITKLVIYTRSAEAKRSFLDGLKRKILSKN